LDDSAANERYSVFDSESEALEYFVELVSSDSTIEGWTFNKQALGFTNWQEISKLYVI